MENYNLTAELKKIASGITSTDPNTELGNINSGVGNLDTAVQGVATAINGLSIPNTGSNIDGVATAINNKTIPDPSSNITAVANAIVSMAGGQDLSDLITILTAMNGNIANLGSNHIVSISEAPGSSTGYYYILGNGDIIPLPNQGSKTSYTDTNNIGATDVQGAIDKLTAYSDGTATINTTYLNGTVNWQKIGRVVSMAIEVSTISNLPGTNWDVALITGLPPVLCPMSWIRRWTLPATDKTKAPMILGMSSNPGVDRTKIYSWGNGAVTSGTSYSASITYITE